MPRLELDGPALPSNKNEAKPFRDRTHPHDTHTTWNNPPAEDWFACIMGKAQHANMRGAPPRMKSDKGAGGLGAQPPKLKAGEAQALP